MDKDLYLLTGSTGLLGGNIVRELASRGCHIRALALKGDPAITDLPRNVEIIEGSLLDDEALELFFSSDDDAELIVIHAAGIVTMDPHPNEKVRAVNVDGTKNIIEKCLQHHTKKLIYISSTSVFQELPYGQKILEVEHIDPNKVIGFYAKTKAMATQLVIQAVRERGLDASVICPSGIFGPNDYGYGMITSCVKMVAEGRLRISIGGTFNSVDARDLAVGILACAEKGEKGAIYIMASHCYTFNELIDSICQAAGIGKPRLTLPLWLIRPFAGLGELYAKLTKKPAWFSPYTIYNLERNNDYSAERAEKELDFKCRPLNDSIADTILWLKQAGKLNTRDMTEHAKRL